MCTTYLGIGSNLGNRIKNLDEATLKISKICNFVCRSSIYETLPRYRQNQPRFLNAALMCSCGLKPNDLLTALQSIETAMGRDRENAGWMGQRTIDIDILLYGSQIIKTSHLIVPHPRLRERKFALMPLIELAPLLTDPINGESYYEVLANLEPQGIYYHSLNRYSQPYAHGPTGQSR